MGRCRSCSTRRCDAFSAREPRPGSPGGSRPSRRCRGPAMRGSSSGSENQYSSSPSSTPSRVARARRTSVKERIQVRASSGSSSTSIISPSSSSWVGRPASSRVSITRPGRGRLAVAQGALGEAAELRGGLVVVAVGAGEEPGQHRVLGLGGRTGEVHHRLERVAGIVGDRRLVAQQLDELAGQRAQQVGLEAGERRDDPPAAAVALEGTHARYSDFCRVAQRPYSCMACTSRSIASRRAGADDGLAVLVDLHHQLLGLLLGVAEVLLEDVADVGHQVDRVVPDDRHPRGGQDGDLVGIQGRLEPGIDLRASGGHGIHGDTLAEHDCSRRTRRTPDRQISSSGCSDGALWLTMNRPDALQRDDARR